MAADDEQTSPRPGSAADLSRRMDRMEQNHESLSREFTLLAGTVSRMEQNQVHAEELNKLRFNSLDTSVHGVSVDLKGFMARIEGMISGEIETAQGRQGRELVDDYRRWREEISEQVDRNAESIERSDAVAKALLNSRQSTGVWVRSVVPWLLSGIAATVTIINIVKGA
jgi:hypothetical protein